MRLHTHLASGCIDRWLEQRYCVCASQSLPAVTLELTSHYLSLPPSSPLSFLPSLTCWYAEDAAPASGYIAGRPCRRRLCTAGDWPVRYRLHFGSPRCAWARDERESKSFLWRGDMNLFPIFLSIVSNGYQNCECDQDKHVTLWD